MEKGGGGRYEDAEHHRRNGDEQATVEEAHIPSNPIIGSKWTLNDGDDDDDDIKMLVEEYLGKDKKCCTYSVFMDFKRAYDRVDRDALWSVLKICGVGGQPLKGIQTFYREANASRLRKDVEDAKVVRGLFSDSDHFAVAAKVRIRDRWEFKGNGRKEGERRELASERLHNSEESQRCERKVEELLSRVRVGMEDNACVSEVFEIFKRSLVQATEEVVGYKKCRRGKKRTAWWTQEIKIAVEEKRNAYKKMLQRNVAEEVREQRKREYRDSKALVKRLVTESEERVDEDFGRKLSAEYVENKKLFWREVREEMGGRKSEACRMRSDGIIVRRNEGVREVWKNHFENVMNEGMGGRAEVTTMGIKIHDERPHTQGRLERKYKGIQRKYRQQQPCWAQRGCLF